MDHNAHVVLNAVSAAGIVATLAGWLPPFAAILAIVWYLIQITESRTFRGIWKAILRR